MAVEMKRVSLLLGLLLVSGCQKQSQATQSSPGTNAPPPAVSASQAPKDGADLVRINGRGFTQGDVDFAGLMLRLQVLSQKVSPAEKAAALKQVDNVNVRLNHLIERYAMGMLGDEKHYSIPEKQITAERQNLDRQLAANPEMQQAVSAYGTERFNGRVHEYLREQVIRQRIMQDLLASEKAKNPKATPDELKYNTGQAYDDLFQNQMDDLQVQINLKGFPPKTAAELAPKKAAPTLTVHDAAGQVLKLPTPTGKRPLLVNFWATWCGPCREELPLLLQVKASGKYDVVVVNVDESPQKVNSFLSREHLEGLPVAYGRSSELTSWRMPGLPTSYLIGEGWTQLDQHFGPLKAGEGWMAGI